MDTIRLEGEDVSEIVYEVVNAKAAGLQNQGKRDLNELSEYIQSVPQM